jgi:hypothetical protein
MIYLKRLVSWDKFFFFCFKISCGVLSTAFGAVTTYFSKFVSGDSLEAAMFWLYFDLKLIFSGFYLHKSIKLSDATFERPGALWFP